MSWISQRRPAWQRYGLAVLLVAVAAACNYWMPSVYGDSHYYFFSVVILASALFGDIGPGLLATALAALVSAYLFIIPIHSLHIETSETAERLAFFLLEGTIISFVGHVIRENRKPAITSPRGRYVAAAMLVAGAVVFKLVLFPGLEQRVPFTFFYSAIVATAWVGGAAPGMGATLLSTICVYLLFFRSGPNAAPGDPGLVLFALEAMSLCLLTTIFRQRLVESESRLGLVFENSPAGILILDESERILKANPAFGEILQTDELSLEGSPFLALVHPDSEGRVRTFLSRLCSHCTVSQLEEVCLLGQTATAWVNLRGSWIGESVHASETRMLLVEDISERRNTEEILRRTEARLERGQRSEAIGMFAGGIAHDFNNLLAVILASTEYLLTQTDLPAESRKYVAEISQAAQSGAGLTRQLLTFARRQPRNDQVVEINELVSDSAALLRRLVGSRIELRTEASEDAGHVRADPSQLQQVLMNLAANARDAMPSGGRLTIRTLRTEMAPSAMPEAALPAGHYVTLEVADTGIGMSEATRARIFEPLFSTKDLEHGAGLGLATVQSIVKKLGGSISVDSFPGEGARFTIHLPSADETQGELRQPEAVRKSGEP